MFKQTFKLHKSSSLFTAVALLRHEKRREFTAAPKLKWDLLSAVCLERHPLVTKDMKDIEKKFQDLLRQIEFENSMKSDHELRAEDELKLEKLKKKDDTELNLELVVKQTAQDFEDSCQEEYEKFTSIAPRITEADNKNVKHTLQRKLDKSLVLLVEQKVGATNYWLPPQGIRREGESMRQTAERVLKEACGDDLQVSFYGNAPMGFYKYKYPQNLRDNGVYGAKIFYFLAKYTAGSVPEKVKHQWLDRQELKSTLPGEINKSISRFLIPE